MCVREKERARERALSDFQLAGTQSVGSFEAGHRAGLLPRFEELYEGKALQLRPELNTQPPPPC